MTLLCHHWSMKVLAVENNAELLKLLSHLLEKEGFEVHTATGGAEALQKFDSVKPDIACLDVLLDDMSGYDICRQIRKADADIKKVIDLIVAKKLEDLWLSGALQYVLTLEADECFSLNKDAHNAHIHVNENFGYISRVTCPRLVVAKR